MKNIGDGVISIIFEDAIDAMYNSPILEAHIISKKSCTKVWDDIDDKIWISVLI